MQSYFCTLPNAYSVVMPDGNMVSCGYRKRTKTMLIICSSAVSLLVVVTVLRCCDCQAAFCMLRTLKHGSSGSSSSSWMLWMQLQWGRSQGVREWLLPQWKLLAVLLDVGSDIWVLVQVRLQTLLAVPTVGSPAAMLWILGLSVLFTYKPLLMQNAIPIISP
jgi:hypothetical protein